MAIPLNVDCLGANLAGDHGGCACLHDRIKALESELATYKMSDDGHHEAREALVNAGVSVSEETVTMVNDLAESLNMAEARIHWYESVFRAIEDDGGASRDAAEAASRAPMADAPYAIRGKWEEFEADSRRLKTAEAERDALAAELGSERAGHELTATAIETLRRDRDALAAQVAALVEAMRQLGTGDHTAAYDLRNDITAHLAYTDFPAAAARYLAADRVAQAVDETHKARWGAYLDDATAARALGALMDEQEPALSDYRKTITE